MLFIVIIVTLIFIWAYIDSKKPHNFPPGPKWYPIFGCAWLLYKLGKETNSLKEASRKLSEKYGPLVGSKIGTNRIVFICGVKETYELFTRDEFNGRPDGVFYTCRTWGERKGILFADCTLWQEQRRFIFRQLREYAPDRSNVSNFVNEEILEMINDIRGKIEQGGGACVLRMDNFFEIHILNTLWIMLTGTKYRTEGSEIGRLAEMLMELFAQFDMIGPLFSHFPILRYICPNLSGYNKYDDVHKKICKFMEQEIENLKKTYNPSAPRGVIDAYLTVMNSSEKNDNYSDTQLQAICLDLFFAGAETSPKTLSFGFLYLLLYPQVQRKAQEELDRIVGRERLPNDTIVMLNGHGFLMDQKAGWKNPEAFDPERYIKDGKHRCIAEDFAKKNLFLIIASFLQNFNFDAVPGNPPLTEFVDGFTAGVKPYYALVTLR
ncbi:hypothetical protein RI129_007287 [Pyrocoelia pectoralis]|uniref:Uncharacterized protein n=1 Tax=Pyrocoelia pectoralis TaxID=417401 RepID=A0AAN7ZGX7_9COLE